MTTSARNKFRVTRRFVSEIGARNGASLAGGEARVGLERPAIAFVDANYLIIDVAAIPDVLRRYREI